MSQREGPFWEMVEGRRPQAPIGQLLNLTYLAIDPERGTAVLEFPGNPLFANPVGVVQGGMLATMLDVTLSAPVRAMLPAHQTLITLEMKVSFIRPAPIATLVGSGRVVRKGTTIAFVEAELRDQGGQLIATATATAQITLARPAVSPAVRESD